MCHCLFIYLDQQAFFVLCVELIYLSLDNVCCGV